MFREKIQNIIRQYDLDNSDIAEYETEILEENCKKFQLQGAYHFWENGYVWGDASEEDIKADAKNLDVAEENLLGYLNSKFLNALEKKLDQTMIKEL